MEWGGLMELIIVFAFALGWGLLELYTLRLDRRKRAQREAGQLAGQDSPPAGRRPGP
jgi:hypothetical protein